jgi:very-short-patch-repair endonuclease
VPKSEAEEVFAGLWRMLASNAPKPVREHRFAAPTRQYRFDFAWPSCKVAVEVEGGIHSKGRHVRPAGYTADIMKYNLATSMGWRVFRATPAMLDKKGPDIVDMLKEAIFSKGMSVP